jgi:hypothetical protein
VGGLACRHGMAANGRHCFNWAGLGRVVRVFMPARLRACEELRRNCMIVVTVLGGLGRVVRVYACKAATASLRGTSPPCSSAGENNQSAPKSDR